MKKALPYLFLLTSSITTQASMEHGHHHHADSNPKFYGKITLSILNEDESSGKTTDLNSHSSRMGIKGKKLLDNGLAIIYKAEYQLSADGDVDTFKKRNIYSGLKGSYGTIKMGQFDTPLKKAQGKIDLFNDFESDINRVITDSDNRSSNIVQYSSPKMVGGIKLNIATILSEDATTSDGSSISLTYKNDMLYAAIAMDSDVNINHDVIRLVAQTKLMNAKVGLLWEEDDNGSTKRDGYVMSVAYPKNDLTFKVQYGDSDIKVQSTSTYSLGVDYTLDKNTKLISYHSVEESDDNNIDNTYTGVGLMVKF